MKIRVPSIAKGKYIMTINHLLRFLDQTLYYMAMKSNERRLRGTTVDTAAEKIGE
jgi:hypothetical protein